MFSAAVSAVKSFGGGLANTLLLCFGLILSFGAIYVFIKLAARVGIVSALLILLVAGGVAEYVPRFFVQQTDRGALGAEQALRDTQSQGYSIVKKLMTPGPGAIAMAPDQPAPGQPAPGQPAPGQVGPQVTPMPVARLDPDCWFEWASRDNKLAGPFANYDSARALFPSGVNISVTARKTGGVLGVVGGHYIYYVSLAGKQFQIPTSLGEILRKGSKATDFVFVGSGSVPSDCYVLPTPTPTPTPVPTATPTPTPLAGSTPPGCPTPCYFGWDTQSGGYRLFFPTATPAVRLPPIMRGE